MGTSVGTVCHRMHSSMAFHFDSNPFAFVAAGTVAPQPPAVLSTARPLRTAPEQQLHDERVPRRRGVRDARALLHVRLGDRRAHLRAVAPR